MAGLLVNIDVENLEQATSFYCAALGLHVGRRFEGDFVVTDLEDALQRAKAAGASVEGGVQSHAWGRIALLADPFGNGFCLLQFTGRGYDEISK